MPTRYTEAGIKKSCTTLMTSGSAISATYANHLGNLLLVLPFVILIFMLVVMLVAVHLFVILVVANVDPVVVMVASDRVIIIAMRTKFALPSQPLIAALASPSFWIFIPPFQPDDFLNMKRDRFNPFLDL